MHFKIAALSSALLLLAPAVTSAPTDGVTRRSNVLVARKGGVFQFASLAGLAKGESKQKWIDSPPSKTFMDTGEYDYDAYFDIAHEPKPIWAAWYPGENEFFQKDADVAKCILDLHSNQKDVCISVKGSSCDNGYIAGGGQLQNIQNNRAGKGLAHDDAESMKAAVDAMVGRKMRTDRTDGHAFGPKVGTTKSQDDPNPSAAYFIRYQGQMEC